MDTSSTRDRYRDQVRGEVKAAALVQLAEGGPAALSVNAIAKGLGVSGPALYRYFPSRDALLAELIRDAYADLAAALGSPAGEEDRADDASGPGSVELVARRYRRWALEQPHRYRLLFQPPVESFDTHAPPLVAASQPAMDALTAALGEPAGAEPSDRALGVWTHLHGFVGLELGGNYVSMGRDADALFEAVVVGPATG